MLFKETLDSVRANNSIFFMFLVNQSFLKFSDNSIPTNVLIMTLSIFCLDFFHTLSHMNHHVAYQKQKSLLASQQMHYKNTLEILQ